MNASAADAADLRMSPWLEGFCAKYGAITVGIFFGTSAKYALALAEGRRLTLRMLAVDILLIGMIALLASNVVTRLGASGDTAATIAALFAVSSDRVIRLVRERFLRRLGDEFRADVDYHKGLIRQEIQAEMSGKSIIDDTIRGTAPADYKTLSPKHPE